MIRSTESARSQTKKDKLGSDLGMNGRHLARAASVPLSAISSLLLAAERWQTRDGRKAEAPPSRKSAGALNAARHRPNSLGPSAWNHRHKGACPPPEARTAKRFIDGIRVLPLGAIRRWPNLRTPPETKTCWLERKWRPSPQPSLEGPASLAQRKQGERERGSGDCETPLTVAVDSALRIAVLLR